ncbi:hypothetical protein LF41_3067 [Lysobacter dokdonensis DS-58]|uniref:Uncharacterized protein n=1 Tax=Lysobacter dokdonensis DS-58 TaxID=1300345 RepID=A0A0A2WM98_9GAMM|nr:hypothetical protein LF41_3067 [Lysobacter dokdonensis DS-58]
MFVKQDNGPPAFAHRVGGFAKLMFIGEMHGHSQPRQGRLP